MIPGLSSSVHDKLARLEAEHGALAQRMADPEVAASASQYREVATRYAELGPLVHCFQELRRTAESLDEARGLLREEKDEDLRSMAREEIAALEPRFDALAHQLQLLLLPKDPNDDKNVVLELRAGTGGEEAALFANDLLRMYQRYVERVGWSFELVDISYADAGGIREAIVNVIGTGAFSRLKYESGVHRVQRVPATEAAGRIHTSAATVAVLPEAEEVEIQIDEAKDLRIDSFSAGGPGGQHVNKTQSAVRITHLPTGLVVQCQDEKSWHKNKARALKVLRARLFDKLQRERQAQEAAARKSMVQSGDRSEKIRTYNFPQNRVTDHRIGLTLHRLDQVMEGDLGELIQGLSAAEQTERLNAESKS
jgi:peptide chain release factor 1